MVLDWCIVAAHQDPASPAKSILAISLQTAPAHDPIFCRWLQKVLDTTLGPNIPPLARLVDQSSGRPSQTVDSSSNPQAPQPAVGTTNYEPISLAFHHTAGLDTLPTDPPQVTFRPTPTQPLPLPPLPPGFSPATGTPSLPPTTPFPVY